MSESTKTLFEMRRRLEQISDEISLAITIKYDLSARLDAAVADMRRIQRQMEETENGET
ncbi:MAG: hypothetical protein LUC17_01030 [Oscillospiraceae bacterium]|nr:hypothetical protein [Oscillospiraceae bacterium]